MKEEIENKIISAAYGDANFSDRLFVKRLIRKDAEAEKLYNEYKATADEVKNISPEECPPEFKEYALRKAGIKEENDYTFTLDLYALLFKKPVYSAAVMAVVAVFIVTSVFIPRENAEPVFTHQEIEQADRQVKTALAIIGEVFNKSRNSIEKDILKDQVSDPLNEGFNLVNELLYKKENKNEKLN